MRKVKIGGWTRIWVVVSLIALAFAAKDLQDGLASARHTGSSAYENVVSWRKVCARIEAQRAKGPLFDFDKGLYENCGADYSEHAALKARNDAFKQATSDAYQSSLEVFLWPTVILGGAFVAIGWVWRGFRRRTPT